MKNKYRILLILVFILAILGTYYFLYSDKFSLDKPPSTRVDLKECVVIDPFDIKSRSELVDAMRKYLADKENVSLDTYFIGEMIGETDCFSLKINNLELYETADGSLVILKDGKKYKKVSSDLWRPD
jgi:hypothetical protein